ncbi:MAG: hypothetical protein J6A24_04695 [Clostridia bacterium]|nr:hypothetical protein [Clostridia bacterium]
MSDLEEYGLEMEPDQHGADPELMPSKPVVVKKSGVGGKILALALGFVIGAGGVIGGVAGAGYWAVTQPVQDVLDTVNNMTGAGIDFSQYINPEYAKLKIMDLVGEIATVAGKFASGQGCLNDLAAISPYVGTALDPLLETLDGFGLSLNKEDLMAKPVAELPNYVLETAKDMKLVDILSSVDANVEDPLYKALCYTEDNQPVTIRTLLEDPSSLLNNVPLATLLIGDKVIDPEKDGLLLSIAYGNANRYVVDTAQNLVVMNAMRFTKEGDKFYDIDGNEVTATLEDGVYTVTVKGEKLYLNTSDSEPNVYFAYEDVEFASPVYYKKVMLGDLMNGGIMEVFYTIELGSLLNISPLDTDPDPITLALAYGEEGTHYEIVDGKIVWLDNGDDGKYKPRTVGDLLKGKPTDLISDIKLGTLFNVSPLDADPDPLTLALAYGEKGTHYEIVDGEIVWLINAETSKQYKPRTVGDLLEGNLTDMVYDLKLGTLLKIDPLQNYDADPSNDPQNLMLALAYGEEGEHYDVVLNTEGEYEIKWLLKEGETEVYHQARTVRDLIENSDTLLKDIRLGTVLDINPLQNHDADPSNDANEIMLALAYGYEGTHYKVVDGKVVWQDNGAGGKYKPKTVQSLTEGDAFGDLRLATVLSVKIDDPSADAMTHAIAFGYEGTDFMFVGDDVYNMDGVTPYDGYRTVSDMSDIGNMVDELRLATVLGVKIDEAPTAANAMTHAIAFGYEGTDFMFVGDDVYNMDGVTPYDGYRTVSDMSNMNDIINGLRIETALSIKPDPNGTRLLQVLAYGSDLAYSDNGDGTYSIVNPDYNTIADLSSSENNLIDRLTINDMLGEENIKDDILLSHLGNATLATLPDEIGNLTFKQVYPDQIYSSRTVYYNDSNNAVLLYCKDGVYYTDSAYTNAYNGAAEIVLEYQYEFGYKVNNGVVDSSTKITEIDGMDGYIAKDKLYFDRDSGFYRYKNGDNEYQVHLVLTGQWKYLLVDPDDPEGYAHNYPLTDFAALVSNMTKNMTKARLYDLNKDKIISLDASTLGTVIVTNMKILGISFTWSPPGGATASNPDGKLRLGDLTVTQIMSYTAEVISFLSHFSA